MVMREPKRSKKIPWEELTPMGYRKCQDKCGEMKQVRKLRRTLICECCYARKRK